MRRARIVGTGGYLPASILTNAELAARVDTSDEWIVERTGIRQRHIAAEGEFQAAQKLADAADIISTNPATLQLRYLQTLVEMGSSNAATIVFPLPMEMMRAFETYSANAAVETPPPGDRPGPPL